MRIACINQDRGISPQRSKGAAVHLNAMRDAFRELGCSVTAFDMPDAVQLEDALQQAGDDFDLVYERYALGKDAGARYARRRGVPFVLEVNAPLADEAARYRGVQVSPGDRDADRFAFGQADCVLSVSTQVAAYARQRGARERALLVRPNGIDTARFHENLDAQAVRAGVVNEDTVVIGFHGRERPWHGFENLVLAVEQLLDRGRDVHLMVVGNGEFAAASRLPAERCTRFGWQPHEDMPSFVAAFDLLPLTYQPGTPFYFSPLKLMEAMACGVVPVAPDMGDLALMVRHELNGLVYTAGDAAGLVAALERLVDDSSLRERLAAQAAVDAREHTWSNIARAVLAHVGQPASAAAWSAA